jgi:hypothetical protein
MFSITPLSKIKLRIKNRHLSEEVKIIKHELRRKELRFDSYKRSSIEGHLDNVVRTELRATQLTIAFLSGKDYNSIEPNVRDLASIKFYIIPRMASMICKYGECKDYSIYGHILSYMEWAKKNEIKGFHSSTSHFKYKDTERQKVIKEYVEKWMGL